MHNVALALLISFVIVIAFMQLAVRLVLLYRQQLYHFYKGKNRQKIEARSSFPSVSSSPDLKRLNAFSDLLRTVHRDATLAQDDYVTVVVRSAACFLLAICALAIDGIRLELPHPLLELSLASIEACSLIFVSLNFLQGRKAIKRWVRLRSLAELMRQYPFLTLLFPNLNEQPPRDITAQFDAEFANIEQQISDIPPLDISQRVQRIWASRKSSIKQLLLTDEDISPSILQLYVQKRLLRQRNWFADARQRLERADEDRKAWLYTLYGIALLLTAAKLSDLLSREANQLFISIAPWIPVLLSPAQLIVTGLAAAATVYYISRNTRSLIHRYNTQERRIQQFYDVYNSGIQSANSDSKNEAGRLVLEFEELMIEELIDWIHISQRDTLEVAP